VPTATIQVAAVTSPDQWSLGAGANKVTAVNSPDDDDLSYITTASANFSEQYSLVQNSIPPGSTIPPNGAFISNRVKRVGGTLAIYVVSLRLGALHKDIGARRAPTAYTSYTDPLGRPGGGSWSPADFDSLEVRITYGTGNGALYCTSLWLIVNYTPPVSTAKMFQVLR